MRKIDTNWKRLLVYCIMGVLAFACLGAAYFENGEEIPFNNEKAHVLTGEWEYTAEDGRKERVQPPARLPVQTGGEVVISRILPEGLGSPVVFCVRTNMQSISLKLEGQVIYTYGTDPDSRTFGKAPGSAWNLVRLPENCAGKRIEISLVSPYPSYSGIIPEIWVGSKAALLFHLLETYAVSLAAALLTFAAGAAILFCYFYFRRRGRIGKASRNLGMFTLLASIWMFADNKLVQFFTGNQQLALYLSVIGLLAFPVPLLAYIRDTEKFRYTKLLQWLCMMMELQFIAVFILQLTGIADFAQLFPVLYLTAGVCILTAFIALLADWRKNRNRWAKAAAIPLLLLIAAGIAQVVIDLVTDNKNDSGILRLGILTYIAAQAFFALKRAVKIYDLSKEASLDVTTGCLNRTAYLKHLQSWDSKDGASVVMADLNGLKKINDSFGHEIGDDAILRCADSFLSTFGSLGKCYRIGGDEFLFLGGKTERRRLEQANQEFQEKCAKEQVFYNFRVASGTAVFEPDSDRSLEEVIRRADKAMYRCKERQKNDDKT